MDLDQADFDDMAFDKHDENRVAANQNLRKPSTFRPLLDLAEKILGTRLSFIPSIVIVGFNGLYRLRPFEEEEASDHDVYIRVPLTEMTRFPVAKTLKEATTTRYLEKHTKIPIARVLHYVNEPQTEPFLIIEHIPNRLTIAHMLKGPQEDPTDAFILDPNISE